MFSAAILSRRKFNLCYVKEKILHYIFNMGKQTQISQEKEINVNMPWQIKNCINFERIWVFSPPSENNVFQRVLFAKECWFFIDRRFCLKFIAWVICLKCWYLSGKKTLQDCSNINGDYCQNGNWMCLSANKFRFRARNTVAHFCFTFRKLIKEIAKEN